MQRVYQEGTFSAVLEKTDVTSVRLRVIKRTRELRTTHSDYISLII
jgi:hypothetical protein